MFKNMKVKFSLILEHTVAVCVCALLIIGCLGAISTQQKNLDRVIDVNIYAQQQVIECRLHANLIARDIREIALFPNSSTAAKMRSDIDQNVAELKEHLEELSRVDPLEDNSVEDYVAKTNAWLKEAAQILSATDRGRFDEARRLIEQNCTPTLLTMADAGDVAETGLGTSVEEARAKQQFVNRSTLIIMITAMVVAVIGIIIFATFIIRNVTRPVEKVRAALVGFSQGKLDVEVDYESKNELGQMCDALRTSQNILSEVISDTGRLLEEMGRGNFNVKTKDEKMYVGALAKLLASIRVINYSLSDTLDHLRQNAEQVAAGADQVSTGSQALAQGATEQASAVEELAATIADIASNAQKNAENSQRGMAHSQQAGDQVMESAKYMEQMVGAMGKISDSSEEIGKIIATIENIAFQTNILALNAAVEAARAGAAGKGFAVVADEVRNLASKSDQAAKATKDLIERSINSVKDGNDIVKSVSDSLEKTVQIAGAVLEDIQSIASAAAQQSSSIDQVTSGLDQISSVVQTNSATSEQSAAASQELSGQAASMKKEMERFQLRDTSGAGQASASSAMPVAASPAAAVAPAPVAVYEEEELTVQAPSFSSSFSKY